MRITCWHSNLANSRRESAGASLLALITVVLLAPTHFIVAADPENAPPTALDAAKHYTSLMKEHQAIKALDTYWDVDSVLRNIFEADMDRHSKDEQAEMSRLFSRFLRAILANQEIADIMASATFDRFTEKPADNARITVEFTAATADKSIPAALVFEKREGKWRVVDTANRGRFMVAGFRSQWLRVKDKMTPLQLIRGIAQFEPTTKKVEKESK